MTHDLSSPIFLFLVYFSCHIDYKCKPSRFLSYFVEPYVVLHKSMANGIILSRKEEEKD